MVHADMAANYYIIAANILLFTHLLYVLFVVAGEVCIIIGRFFHWQWIRRIPFRVIHLAAVGIVAIQDLLGLPCPLTVWEYRLRELGGQLADWEMTFVEKLLRNLVFPGFPAWFFEIIYVFMGIIVILTFVLIPPRKKAKIKNDLNSNDFA